MNSSYGKYIEINGKFSVTVSKNIGKPQFTWDPDAIYITHDRFKINFHYAGDKAGDSSAVFSVPTDSNFLRRLSEALMELADQYSVDSQD